MAVHRDALDRLVHRAGMPHQHRAGGNRRDLQGRFQHGKSGIRHAARDHRDHPITSDRKCDLVDPSQPIENLLYLRWPQSVFRSGHSDHVAGDGRGGEPAEIETHQHIRERIRESPVDAADDDRSRFNQGRFRALRCGLERAYDHALGRVVLGRARMLDRVIIPLTNRRRWIFEAVVLPTEVGLAIQTDCANPAQNEY